MRESKSYYVNFGQKSQKFDKVYVTDTFFLQDTTNFSVQVDTTTASSTSSTNPSDAVVEDQYVFFNAEEMREAIVFVRNAGLTTISSYNTTIISDSFGIGYTEEEYNLISNSSDIKKLDGNNEPEKFDLFVKNGSLFQGTTKFIPDGIDSGIDSTSMTITSSDIYIATNSIRIDGNIIADNDLTIDGNGNSLKLKNENGEVEIGNEITINSEDLVINQSNGINITTGSLISQGVAAQFSFDDVTFGNDIADQPSTITFSTSNSTKIEIYIVIMIQITLNPQITSP